MTDEQVARLTNVARDAVEKLRMEHQENKRLREALRSVRCAACGRLIGSDYIPDSVCTACHTARAAIAEEKEGA